MSRMKSPPIVGHAETEQGSVQSYTVGFVLSVIFTLAAFNLALSGIVAGWALLGGLVALALLQLFVQLRFFMHLGGKGRPNWNRLVFNFMIGTVLILVIGSLWIMHNLNYHMMDMPSDTEIIHDEGIH